MSIGRSQTYASHLPLQDSLLSVSTAQPAQPQRGPPLRVSLISAKAVGCLRTGHRTQSPTRKTWSARQATEPGSRLQATLSRSIEPSVTDWKPSRHGYVSSTAPFGDK